LNNGQIDTNGSVYGKNVDGNRLIMEMAGYIGGRGTVID